MKYFFRRMLRRKFQKQVLTARSQHLLCVLLRFTAKFRRDQTILTMNIHQGSMIARVNTTDTAIFTALHLAKSFSVT